MSISRILNEFRPLFHLLEEPLMRSPVFYARPQRMLLEDALRNSLGGLGALVGQPPVDVMEEGDQYIVAADVPGIKKEDIEIRVGEDGRSLTIEGRIAQKSEEVVASEETVRGETRGEKSNELARERFYSVNKQFERTVWLPRAIEGDSVRARLQDGVLRVTASKAGERGSRVVAVE
ncbi:hypothetical protein APHAL10511_002544 [Amanita phalloides]|nr:hypothetical protein APHAL10511_002544 [Amanita phalloides]